MFGGAAMVLGIKNAHGLGCGFICVSTCSFFPCLPMYELKKIAKRLLRARVLYEGYGKPGKGAF